MGEAAEKSEKEEARIRAHARASRKRLDYSREGLPAMYLRLARRWQRPVQEIKRIEGRGARDDH